MPASGERLYGGFARGLEAVRRIAAVTEGKIDRPYPRLAMVSQTLNSAIRPTICPSAITSYWVGFPVGCSTRSVMYRLGE